MGALAAAAMSMAITAAAIEICMMAFGIAPAGVTPFHRLADLAEHAVLIALAISVLSHDD